MTRGNLQWRGGTSLNQSYQPTLDVAEQLADQTECTACLLNGRFPRLTGVAKDPGIGGQSRDTPTERFQRSFDLRALESQLGAEKRGQQLS
jgi:hypothetical protein